MKMNSKGFKPRLQYAQLDTGSFVVRDNTTGKTHLITNIRTQKNLKRISRLRAYFKERKEHPELSKKTIEKIVRDHEKKN